MSQEMIKMIMDSVFTILSVLITAYVIPWIKSKIGALKYAQLVEYTEIAERAAKELFKDNSDKREYVISVVTQYAENVLGMNVNENMVRMVLEGVYNLYKDSINEGK